MEQEKFYEQVLDITKQYVSIKNGYAQGVLKASESRSLIKSLNIVLNMSFKSLRYSSVARNNVNNNKKIYDSLADMMTSSEIELAQLED